MQKPTVIIASALLFAPVPALAYLDPGTGSLILQMLIAGFFGALLYVGQAWDRTRLFFTGLFFRRKSPDDTNEEHPSADDDDGLVDEIADDRPQPR